MRVTPTVIPGVRVIHLDPFQDHRGMFVRTLCMDELSHIGHRTPIVQVNHSITMETGAVRGMHYQVPPKAETKIVRCLRGRVFDVVIDVRQGSPTWLQWFGAELSATNMQMMYVPEGCAHGFQVLEPASELLYCHTAAYSPEHEHAVRFDDPSVNIEWPLPVSDVSARDRSHPLLTADFCGVTA